MKNRLNRRNFLRISSSTACAAPLLAMGQALTQSQIEKPFLLRFAVASDGHFGQPETDFKRFHDQMISWLGEESLGKGLDFVIFNGDLIHDKPEFLPQVKATYDRLQIPYYVTKGNHDMVSGAVWKETWGYEENHDIDAGQYALLLGTTSNEAGDYLCADVDWLRDGLDKHGGKKYIFVFLHISQNKMTRHAVSCPEVTSLLERTENVAAVFHGHDHDLDNVIFSNERAYLFDGHVGGSWGTNYRGYRIVEVDRQTKIQTYQCNPQAFYVNGMQLG